LEAIKVGKKRRRFGRKERNEWKEGKDDEKEDEKGGELMSEKDGGWRMAWRHPSPPAAEAETGGSRELAAGVPEPEKMVKKVTVPVASRRG
jgi:hypothetical protein